MEDVVVASLDNLGCWISYFNTIQRVCFVWSSFVFSALQSSKMKANERSREYQSRCGLCRKRKNGKKMDEVGFSPKARKFDRTKQTRFTIGCTLFSFCGCLFVSFRFQFQFRLCSLYLCQFLCVCVCVCSQIQQRHSARKTRRIYLCSVLIIHV